MGNERPTLDVTPQDWQDLEESEFVDVVESPLSDSIGFVFEHEEIGFHGLQWRPNETTLKAVSYEQKE